MKNVKKALLVTSMAGALFVGAGYGSYSWFTSSTQADGTINNGTLSLNNNQPITTKLFTTENFAPSQFVTGDFVTLDNTGTLDQNLKLTYTATVDKASVNKYKIMYVAFKSNVQPSDEDLKKWSIQIEKGFFKGNSNPHPMLANSNPASQPTLPAGVKFVTGEALPEVAMPMFSQRDSSPTSDDLSKKYNLGNDDFFSLNSDEYINIAFAVKLDESAGNEYQGAKYNAKLTVLAKQTDTGAEFGK